MKTKKIIKILSTTLVGLACLMATPAQPHQATNWDVRIELAELTCYNTEDSTGADELYALGAMTLNLPSGKVRMVPFVVPPMDINSDNVPHRMDKVLLTATLPPGTNITGELSAFDEDAAKDWGDVGQKFTDAVVHAGDEAASLGKKAGLIGKAVGAGMKIVSAAMGLDKDDPLGTIGTPAVAVGKTPATFRYRGEVYNGLTKTLTLKKSGFWSDFHYTVKYTVYLTPTTNLPTIQ
jgi:hypothetical protein